jgi:hypothetical protein
VRPLRAIQHGGDSQAISTARQKQLGVVPQDAKLAPKHEAIKDWDKLSDDEKTIGTS